MVAAPADPSGVDPCADAGTQAGFARLPREGPASPGLGAGTNTGHHYRRPAALRPAGTSDGAAFSKTFSFSTAN